MNTYFSTIWPIVNWHCLTPLCFTPHLYDSKHVVLSTTKQKIVDFILSKEPVLFLLQNKSALQAQTLPNATPSTSKHHLLQQKHRNFWTNIAIKMSFWNGNVLNMCDLSNCMTGRAISNHLALAALQSMGRKSISQ